jgi:hypothetical protein
VAHGSRPAPLRLRKLRDLDLAEPPEAGRPAFLSAASGLVKCGGGFYVVADDELHLGRFTAGASQPGTPPRPGFASSASRISRS